MIAFVNHCTTVCKGNRKKEEGSKVDLHFFPMQFFYKKRETKLKQNRVTSLEKLSLAEFSGE